MPVNSVHVYGTCALSLEDQYTIDGHAKVYVITPCQGKRETPSHVNETFVSSQTNSYIQIKDIIK